MKTRALIVAFLILSAIPCAVSGQDDLISNPFDRPSKSLNGEWRYIVDPYENGYFNYRYEPFDGSPDPGSSAYYTNAKPKDKTDRVEYDFEKSDIIRVPGDWNSQKEKLFYYEGTIWYEKSFDYPKAANGNRVFLYFGAVNYKAEVYVNGKKVGTHIGGFTPFNFEVTGLLKEKRNFVVVKADNKRLKEGVPTLNTDWWNYGGITRDVNLIEMPSVFIRDQMVRLDGDNDGRITGRIVLDGASVSGKWVEISIPELGFRGSAITDEKGVAEIRGSVKGLRYWSPDDPKLYEVRFSSEGDSVTDRIGFRTVKVSGDRILLNGKDIFLKGISIHEENPLRGGRANSVDDAKLLLGWAKELGCNFVRLAHYPHNENMVRLADEMGILVWEEIPVYWTIQWENPETFDNASAQLEDVITRDKNRASVIIWSMANETPVSEPRNRFLTKLAETARRSDPTRLISAALEMSGSPEDATVREITDPFAEKVDIISFNQYIGWYDGLPEKLATIKWRLPKGKPIFISEFGAGARFGLHGAQDERWTEEFQEVLYKETLKSISGIGNLRGFSPWILVDFRSPRRHLPEIQDGWNRKGLLSEKGEKKKAFFVLRDFYRQKSEQRRNR